MGASGLLGAGGSSGSLLKVWPQCGAGGRQAEEWARDKGGQSPRWPFLSLPVELLLLLQSPWTRASGAGHLPPRDFLSAFLSPAHRRHLRAGPPRPGAPHSAASHSQSGPGAARQQVFVVKGTGRKQRVPTIC